MTVTMKLPCPKPVTLVPNLYVGPDPNQAPRHVYTRRTWVLRKARCIYRAREPGATRRNSQPYCDESQRRYRVREMGIVAENLCVTSM